MPARTLKSPLVKRAFTFARHRHKGQLRKGDSLPFITHPLAVARLLAKARLPEEVVAAGLLHDVLEDTDATVREVKSRFGPRVAGLVQEVTEPAKVFAWEERKAAYLKHLKAASPGAMAISCADKLHNTNSLLAAYRREGPVVFTRFSRVIQKKLNQDRRVYEAIQRAYPECPLLPELDRGLKKLETIARRHRTLSHRTEVEAKFLVKEASVLNEVASLRSLDGFRLVKRLREKQRNTYLDTEDLALKKARAVLKLREVGGKAQLTFKSELGYFHGVSRRMEVTVPVREAQVRRLFLKGQLDIEPIHRAQALIGRRPLKGLFTLLTDRRRLILASQRDRVELDLDRVTVHTTKGIARRHLEVELENINASPAAYKRALLALRRRFGKRLKSSRVWKAEYGFRAIGKGKPRFAGHLWMKASGKPRFAGHLWMKASGKRGD